MRMIETAIFFVDPVFYQLDNVSSGDFPMFRRIHHPLDRFPTKFSLLSVAYKKLHFFCFVVLTWKVGWDYKPLTNEGGGAAGDRRTRSEVSYESLVRIVGLRRERLGPSW